MFYHVHHSRLGRPRRRRLLETALHVLHTLLPKETDSCYDFRHRRHNRILIIKSKHLADSDSIIRMVYQCTSYCFLTIIIMSIVCTVYSTPFVVLLCVLSKLIKRIYDDMMTSVLCVNLGFFRVGFMMSTGSLQWSDTVDWATCKKDTCWFVGGDDLTGALHIAPAVDAISIILSSS